MSGASGFAVGRLQSASSSTKHGSRRFAATSTGSAWTQFSSALRVPERCEPSCSSGRTHVSTWRGASVETAPHSGPAPRRRGGRRRARRGVRLGIFAGRWWDGKGGTYAPRHLVLRTTVIPRRSLFGQVITATVRVVVDPRRIEPGTLRVAGAFRPWSVRSEQKTLGRIGRARVVSVRYSLQCLVAACLPRGGTGRARAGATAFTFHDAQVTGRRTDGSALRTAISWPSFGVQSRLTAQDLALGEPQVERPLAAPAVTWRLSPNVLGGIAGGLAILFVLGAGGARRFGRARRRAAAPRPPDPCAHDACRSRARPCRPRGEAGRDGGESQGARTARRRAAAARSSRARRRCRTSRMVSRPTDARDRCPARRRGEVERCTVIRARRSQSPMPAFCAEPFCARARHSRRAGPSSAGGCRGRGVSLRRRDIRAGVGIPPCQGGRDRRPRCLVQRSAHHVLPDRADTQFDRRFQRTARSRPLLGRRLRGPPDRHAGSGATAVLRFFAPPPASASATNDQTYLANSPWQQWFSAGTRISSGLYLAEHMLEQEHAQHGAVLLISDLADDPSRPHLADERGRALPAAQSAAARSSRSTRRSPMRCSSGGCSAPTRLFQLASLPTGRAGARQARCHRHLPDQALPSWPRSRGPAARVERVVGGTPARARCAEKRDRAGVWQLRQHSWSTSIFPTFAPRARRMALGPRRAPTPTRARRSGPSSAGAWRAHPVLPRPPRRASCSE